MFIRIDSGFPGGNITVERIDGDEVHLHQNLRDTTQPWFYWCLRIRGAQGRTLRFVFTESRALGVRGPAISADEGVTWRWLGADGVAENTYTHTFAADAADVRLSFGMPYQLSAWQRFVEPLSGDRLFSLHPLCVTAQGRHVEYALLGASEAEPLHRVAITCRHHCCEMMANYALEGLIQWVIGDGAKGAAWLRDHVEFLFVPFADLDGVEDGDQGKGRRPRDHGRDYQGESIYPSTAALRALLPAWSDGRLCIGVDLHCPWIAGEHNEVIYLVGSKDEQSAREQRHFSQLLESVCSGPLPFRAEDYLAFGTAWNTDANTVDGRGFSRWAAQLPTVKLGTSIEIPYANTHGAEVNQVSARRFGADLGAALAEYLTPAGRPARTK